MRNHNRTMLFTIVLFILSPFISAAPSHLSPPPEKESWFERIIEYIIGKYNNFTK